jgi:hypothetical protein
MTKKQILCDDTSPHFVFYHAHRTPQLEPDLPETDINNDNDDDITAKPALYRSSYRKLRRLFCAVVCRLMELDIWLPSFGIKLLVSIETYPRWTYSPIKVMSPSVAERMDESLQPGVKSRSSAITTRADSPTDGIINLRTDKDHAQY